jgi:hypothetical protein
MLEVADAVISVLGNDRVGMHHGADDQPISIMSKIHRAEEWLPKSRRGNSGLCLKNYF